MAYRCLVVVAVRPYPVVACDGVVSPTCISPVFRLDRPRAKFRHAVARAPWRGLDHSLSRRQAANRIVRVFFLPLRAVAPLFRRRPAKKISLGAPGGFSLVGESSRGFFRRPVLIRSVCRRTCRRAVARRQEIKPARVCFSGSHIYRESRRNISERLRLETACDDLSNGAFGGKHEIHRGIPAIVQLL